MIVLKMLKEADHIDLKAFGRLTVIFLFIAVILTVLIMQLASTFLTREIVDSFLNFLIYTSIAVTVFYSSLIGAYFRVLSLFTKNENRFRLELSTEILFFSSLPEITLSAAIQIGSTFLGIAFMVLSNNVSWKSAMPANVFITVLLGIAALHLLYINARSCLILLLVSSTDGRQIYLTRAIERPKEVCRVSKTFRFLFRADEKKLGRLLRAQTAITPRKRYPSILQKERYAQLQLLERYAYIIEAEAALIFAEARELVINGDLMNLRRYIMTRSSCRETHSATNSLLRTRLKFFYTSLQRLYKYSESSSRIYLIEAEISSLSQHILMSTNSLLADFAFRLLEDLIKTSAECHTQFVSGIQTTICQDIDSLQQFDEFVIFWSSCRNYYFGNHIKKLVSYINCSEQESFDGIRYLRSTTMIIASLLSTKQPEAAIKARRLAESLTTRSVHSGHELSASFKTVAIDFKQVFKRSTDAVYINAIQTWTITGREVYAPSDLSAYFKKDISKFFEPDPQFQYARIPKRQEKFPKKIAEIGVKNDILDIQILSAAASIDTNLKDRILQSPTINDLQHLQMLRTNLCLESLETIELIASFYRLVSSESIAYDSMIQENSRRIQKFQQHWGSQEDEAFCQVLDQKLLQFMYFLIAYKIHETNKTSDDSKLDDEVKKINNYWKQYDDSKLLHCMRLKSNFFNFSKDSLKWITQLERSSTVV